MFYLEHNITGLILMSVRHSEGLRRRPEFSEEARHEGDKTDMSV